MYRLFEATGFIGNTKVGADCGLFNSIGEIEGFIKAKHNNPPYIRQLGPTLNKGAIWLDYGSHSHFYVATLEMG